MPELYRFSAAAIRTFSTRWEAWVSVAVMTVFVLVVGGGVAVLAVQYRSGWVASQQVSMDKATAIHKLLFRP